MLGGLTNIKGIADKKAKEIIKKRKDGEPYTPAIAKKLSELKTPFDILYPADHYFGELYKNPNRFGLASPPKFIKNISTEQDENYTILGKVISKELVDHNSYNEVVKRNGKKFDHSSLSIKLIIEDDTGQINCRVDRFKFEKLDGRLLFNSLEVDESWLLIKGSISQGWRILNVSATFNLNELDI